MLELKNIKKSYYLDKSTTLPVLKGINLVFNDNEFVAILGPSGCGKTTMLNIIGGLDRYTDGDLVVDGTATKDFSDRDWDTYRNRRIGIVFQSYNLIPHLTVLANVELAMTLSGTSIKYRKKKALEVLKSVGLESEVNKKPNQLSGGQMQRVAIARALVNNPGIILADEPTGALDSKTSTQIMDILKEIGKTHLVIMVTHNEDLAVSYATRIVRMLDGNIISDEETTNKVEIKAAKKDLTATIDEGAPDLTIMDESLTSQLNESLSRKKGRKNKSSMSFTTALNISSHNLFTKKGRATLTSIAGSFGIIGVALVLSLSNGFKGYISRMERETLAQFPVSVEKYGMTSDLMSMNNSNKDKGEAYPDSDVITVDKPAQNTLHVNTITQEYIDYLDAIDPSLVNSVKYNYSVQMNAVTLDSAENAIVLNTSSSSMVSSLMGGSSNYWSELPGDEDFIRSQYDVIGKYPQNSGEIVISVDKYNKISYGTMASLGYDVTMDATASYKDFTFEDIIGKTYKVFSNDDLYRSSVGGNASGFFLKSDASISGVAQLITQLYNLGSISDRTPEQEAELQRLLESMMDLFEENRATKELKYYSLKDGTDLKDLYTNKEGKKLKVVGILRPKPTTAVDLLSYGVYYTQDLTKEVLELNAGSMLADELRNHCFLSISGGSPTLNFMTAIGEYSSTDLSGYMNERLRAATDKDITSITIFPKSFNEKKQVLSYLDAYNKDRVDGKIVYTDLASVLTSSVGNMVDIISIVLICFAAVAMMTSTVMIGIITYTSVIERTKEIGILRSIGARKKDVGRLFQAETMIIGLISGLIGIIVTVVLCLPINAILQALYPTISIGNIASLNPLHALILLIISVLLTFVAGFLPARVAAKKDPVICLRSE